LPGNLRIVRFENLEADLHRAVGEFCSTAGRLPRLNATVHKPYSDYLSPAAEEAIHNKYRWVFDRQFYEREITPGQAPAATLRHAAAPCTDDQQDC